MESRRETGFNSLFPRFFFVVGPHQPETVPQACIDMNRVVEVSEAEEVTGHAFSLALTAADRVHFLKGTSREESKWWFDVLSMFPRTNLKVRAARDRGDRTEPFPSVGDVFSPTLCSVGFPFWSWAKSWTRRRRVTMTLTKDMVFNPLFPSYWPFDFLFTTLAYPLALIGRFDDNHQLTFTIEPNENGESPKCNPAKSDGQCDPIKTQ